MHRAFRLGVAQLPIHPQYLDAGTLYIAETQEPLNFGDEEVKEQTLQSIGTPPPAGSLVRASLLTPLDSGTTKRGETVQAVVCKPTLLDKDSSDSAAGNTAERGRGATGAACMASEARNGQLRIAFHELVLPSGSTFRVDTTLAGIQGGQNDNLDQEGAAKATNPKSRYITTGIAVTLAMIGSGGKNDVGAAGPAAGGAVALFGWSASSWGWRCARTRWPSL